MNKRKKNKKKWSRKHFQITIGVWNCWSLSNERHNYCESLNYDILALTELHNTQDKYKGRRWVCSAPAGTDKNGRSNDPAAGVAITLSPRIANKVLDTGHVGTRIVWVKIAGPVCNIFFIATYIPHKGRTQKPRAEDTIKQLQQLMKTIPKSDCIMLAGDFNCQLPRNTPGCTGRWCMTTRMNEKGHGQQVLDLMRQNDLFAVGTMFKPKKKLWSDKYRRCNATYLQKDEKKRPTKLDYLCISNRWKAMAIQSEVKWGPSIHRFGHRFDHGLLSAKWRWKTKTTHKKKTLNLKAMNEDRLWPAFDEALRLKLQQEHEPKPTKINKTNPKANLSKEYENLSKSVYETISEVVPEKKWLKKNGRVVSGETKKLFEKRAQAFNAKAPTPKERKKWSRKIRNACRNDYRAWVSSWVQKIEKADEQGDTKKIYAGVKALTGSNTNFARTRPTERHQEKHAVKRNIFREEKVTDTAKNTDARASKKHRREDETTHRARASENRREGKVTDKDEAEARASENVTEKEAKEKTKASGNRINGPRELAGIWHEFLQRKFSTTELEKARAEFKDLPEIKEEDRITWQEYCEAVKHLKDSKATGADGIPVEIWKGSTVAKQALFEFLQKVWSKESVPENLVVCIFVMIFKRKGSHNDCSKYRAIGLLNHAYKVMSVVLLRRLVEECGQFFSEWQAGFRTARGCRDNILLLRLLYDQVIKRDRSCIITYIDYTAAFDSISHKFMDKTLARAGASRKTRAMFRAIYSAATGIARVRHTDGKCIYSEPFKVRRGVIQGDIISPVLFILALDQIFQAHDKSGEGVKAGSILRVRTLGYADDAALCEETVEEMSKRLTAIANASIEQADMYPNVGKTFTQHVHKRQEIDVTETEVAEIEKGYDFKCDYCSRRFKTQRNMRIHKSRCKYGYGTTEQYYELEEIVGVFGSKASRWYQVKWAGYSELEWERENLLMRDGCQDVIKDFWVRSGLNPSKQYYPDPDSRHRCTVCGHTYKRKQDLKAHQTRMKHRDTDKKISSTTAVRDAKTEKRKKQQKLLPMVRWGEKDVQNCWRFPYLGSLFEAGGDNMPDVSRRIAMAKARFDKLRNLWSDNNLHLNLKLRLYRSSVCSILTYGSEAWYLTSSVTRALNGANSQMMAIITGKTQQQEASKSTQTFDLIKWIRARRLQ